MILLELIWNLKMNLIADIDVKVVIFILILCDLLLFLSGFFVSRLFRGWLLNTIVTWFHEIFFIFNGSIIAVFLFLLLQIFCWAFLFFLFLFSRLVIFITAFFFATKLCFSLIADLSLLLNILITFKVFLRIFLSNGGALFILVELTKMLVENRIWILEQLIAISLKVIVID